MTFTSITAPSQETTNNAAHDNDMSHLIDPLHVFSGQITELMPDTANFLPPMAREGWHPPHDLHTLLERDEADCALTPDSDFQDDFVDTPSPTTPENTALDWAIGANDGLAQIFGQT
ncbi:hypothetical protein QBC36DRAFT_310070 [Triangularia setosa]|uniref:Uncharacterized protein n=1 Tax=Triangularia setosa TaxID=2587417 RepID=A0AAN6W8V2_9PEZI|nr:hypothetical protein QBC36DRAFT_310070 [Podospora setosa]